MIIEYRDVYERQIMHKINYEFNLSFVVWVLTHKYLNKEGKVLNECLNLYLLTGLRFHEYMNTEGNVWMDIWICIY